MERFWHRRASQPDEGTTLPMALRESPVRFRSREANVPQWDMFRAALTGTELNYIEPTQTDTEIVRANIVIAPGQIEAARADSSKANS